MPLVFVHGVSNRDSDEYRDTRTSRDSFFRVFIAPKLGLPEVTEIFNPYWGDFGAKFRWKNQLVPEAFGGIETLGALDSEDLRLAADALATVGTDSTDIVPIAKRSLQDAIDLLWSLAIPVVKNEREAIALARLYDVACNYARSNPDPDWLAGAGAENFVHLLAYEMRAYGRPAQESEQEWESFGAGGALDDLKEAASRLAFLPGAKLTALANAIARRRIHLGASMFIGDVFKYLSERGDRGSPGTLLARC